MKVHKQPQGKWLYELDFQFMKKDDIPVGECSKLAVAEVKALAAAVAAKDDDLCEQLNSLADDFEMAADDVEEYDACMYELYELADAYRVWVKTTI